MMTSYFLGNLEISKTKARGESATGAGDGRAEGRFVETGGESANGKRIS